ncbi:MAG: group 1 glycosyl transferase [Bdellovibrio sp. CG12_big_fil_rev_8_21_14_0_65_39_13]|nr:MAG: group 1 glycosyl transferase [Bdellovibrio sp. CG22_combo_CG10-13_8_21_14_all_39_27]PIQ58430.1 MAG: group 1 glycosyl transferase [Bdellovibrio sp. CG12_big_fil_rev_8_21_14_0_65_39_13]PIR35383.1 MAG: group 1 glycosyl transferase [Bdellovibrio sp. CG11_big_fil_rev_8_21_14_0_20_39_38]
MSDVCLLLEGTFPYVTGGVSSCVYQLIKNTPQVKYCIVYIGASEMDGKEYKYPIPENVTLIKEVFLFDYDIEGNIHSMGDSFPKDLISDFHQKIRNWDLSQFEVLFNRFFKDTEKFNEILRLFQSKESWDFLVRTYEKRFTQADAVSFIDFFYTWRFTHYPVFKALSQELPRAKVYHSLSTGYAGLMGVAAKLRYNKPFILTEHGIYSHEREIEILQAEWIFNTDKEVKAVRELSFFKEWWIKIFHFLSRIAYYHSDQITTLYIGNKKKQIANGAREEKIALIANGINISDFDQVLIDRKTPSAHKTIALVGRVVPIKDIKTFIKAMAIVVRSYSDLDVLIIGPWEEDQDYYEECVKLINMFDLGEVVKFTGKVDVKKYYTYVDVMVLSSISEGQPMVILEAYACRIPVVATDVGSCRELVYGSSDEDKELGESGIVVPFGMPDQLAKAILKIISDEQIAIDMGNVGRKRVEQFYREDLTVGRYLQLYNNFIGDQT